MVFIILRHCLPPRRANVRFVILHYHIFKNAGTAIENLLRSNFGPHFAQFEGDGLDCQLSGPGLVAWLKQHPEIRAISSHQLRYPKPEAPGFVFFDLCFLRDPIDRIYSIYTFFRKHPPQSDSLSVLAHETTLGASSATWLNAVHIWSTMSRSPCSPPTEPTSGRRPREIWPVQRRPCWACLFRVWLTAFTKAWWPASTSGGQCFPEFDNAALPANVSRDPGSTLESRLRAMRSACGRTLYEELERLNSLDRELVRRARMEVARRFRLTPDHERRLAELRARVQEKAGVGISPPKALCLRRVARSPR
jgi:hypothetical protein